MGRRFQRQWIFRNLDHVFENGKSYAITGHNGSGKSTLVQALFNFQSLSEGQITYSLNGKDQNENPQRHISFAAPYLELPEEFTLDEMLRFHFGLVEMKKGMSLESIIAESGLRGQEQKAIKLFSSGMKQRLKLSLALFANTPLLLLDEPCSNFDEQGIQWYRNEMQGQLGTRTIIIASNQQSEFDFCEQQLAITNYK